MTTATPDMQVPSVVKDAATVVLVRDGSTGLEVFLLKRHNLSDAFGGAFVFPGGKVDASDSDPAHAGSLDQGPGALHAALGEPNLSHVQVTGLFIAAIRESLEESGVLLAREATRLEARHVLEATQSGLAFMDAVRSLNLQLNTHGLIPWKRWITPKLPTVGSKRFDTRFFVAAMPAQQDALHDAHETTESVWMTPRAALQAYGRGDIDMAPPQIVSLAELGRYSGVEALMAAIAGMAPPLIEPESFTQDGERFICFPGDPRHSQSQTACCGPLRMILRNRRFEPPEGVEAFFT